MNAVNKDTADEPVGSGVLHSSSGLRIATTVEMMMTIMIAGHLKVPADRRREFVEAHADLVSRARAYPGCLDLSICEDPFDPSRVNLMELWESEAVLQEWRKISNPPRTGVEFEDANIRKHHISQSGSPF